MVGSVVVGWVVVGFVGDWVGLVGGWGGVGGGVGGVDGGEVGRWWQGGWCAGEGWGGWLW